jgi:hypothetical protein
MCHNKQTSFYKPEDVIESAESVLDVLKDEKERIVKLKRTSSPRYVKVKV